VSTNLPRTSNWGPQADNTDLIENAGMVTIDHCADMGLIFAGVDKPDEEGMMAKFVRGLFLPDNMMQGSAGSI
jgi:hypothetical protein